MARIYLDYAATTPVDKTVLKKMLPYFSRTFGNAMSIHSFGQDALRAVDGARTKIAEFFNCSPTEIIFTSGATESNNLTIKGVLRSYYSKIQPVKSPQKRGADKNQQFNWPRPHIITTQFEHHCILDACKTAEKDGLAEITYLPVNKDGVIKVADVKKAIKTNTILVSIMYVNNEIGTVQPIKEIGALIKKIRRENTKYQIPDTKYYPLFHTDATQAVNYFDCDLEKLGVDLLSMSAHKIYGPKGVGMLYVRKNTPIKRIQDGGDQEYKMRAGTHNVPGIVGLGEAIELVHGSRSTVHSKILDLRNYLIKKVLQEIPKSYLNGSKEKRSPNNANFRFDNVEGEGLVLSLDMEGIAASTGSACSSGALEPSHVLLSIGLKPEKAHGSLRLTLGKYTTKQEIDMAVTKLKEIIARLRQISGKVLEEFQD